MILWLLSAHAYEQNWPPPPENPMVRSVYDGDTLTLENGDKVRLSWVNTPELKPAEEFGKEAGDFTRALVVGKKVQLVLQGENPRDGYGRLLSGIVVDGTNLSYALLEQGLGHVFIIPPEQYDITPLLEAQTRARAARKGIWSSEHYQGTLHITSFHANADGDDEENLNGEYLRIANISDGPLNLAGYRIAKAAGLTFELPDVTVPQGYTFTLHTGRGANQTKITEQIRVYLNQDQPIWNNDGDRATLYDRFGKIMDFREHAPKSSSKR